MADRLYDVVFFISVFLYIIFIIFLFTHEKRHGLRLQSHQRLSNRIFAGFCIFSALIIITDLCSIYRQDVYRVFPAYLDVILESAFFLVGPFLYFYTLSITKKNFLFKKHHLLHFIPFLLDLIFRNYRFFSQSNVHAVLMERGYFISYPELKTRYILMESQVLIYIIVSLIVLYLYRSRLKDYFSSVDKIKLSWLSLVLLGFFVSYLMHLLKLTLAPLSMTLKAVFGIGTHIGSLLMATVVVYKGLSQPEIFSELETRSSNQKYAKTALSQEKMEKYLKELIHYMETEKPYLNPSLNITELAQRLSVPSHYVSQILSRRLNQNFYHFVNKYRIEESKRILAATSNHNKTVLEVLYETGFNSKSTFNSIFKQYTGMTPTQFIVSQQSNLSR